MKLQGRIPVEPLEDERLTNIERNLVVAVSEMRAPAQHAPRRLLAFAGAMAAVAVAGFVGYKLRGGGAQQGEPHAQTFAMVDSTVKFGDAEITSAKGTEIAVTREPTSTRVKMARGRLDLHVDHKADRLFVVNAGDTIIEDIGTRFSVDYDGKNHVEVRVTEGEVKVKRAGKEFRITVNEAWTTEDGETTIAMLDEKLAVAAGTHIAVATPDPSDNSGQPHVPDVANVGSAGSGSAGSAGSNAGSGARPKAGKTDAKKAVADVPLQPQDVGTTDPAAAKAKYLELVRNMQEGEDRARILYSIAVMEHRQKKDKEALHSLSGVLKRNGGEAYKDALWLELRIRCLKAFDDECRGAAARYVRKFPDGRPSGAADEVLKEISRAQ